MVVYIAHSSRHKSYADLARAGLAAGPQTKAACSQDFDDRGAATSTNPSWGTREQALTDATLFLVLLPPADAPVDVSIGVQLGTYLQICRQAKTRPEVVCLHHADENPADIVAQCTPDEIRTVPGIEADVMAFVKLHYPGDGPGADVLRQTITSILLRAVGAGGPPIERHPTSPTLTVTMAESTLASLSAGQIPPTAMIGGHKWWVLFGLASGDSGILWQDLRSKLQSPDTWEPILAEELDFVRRADKDKKQQREVIPILVGTAGVPATAAVLQKYEVFPGVAGGGGGTTAVAVSKVHRFTLAAFTAPMLYDPSDLSDLANAFHLATVAQLFRFMVIQKDLPELKRLKSLTRAKASVPLFPQEFNDAIGNLRRHVLLIDVESRRRNFTGRFAGFDRVVYNAYGVDDKGKDQTADTNQERLTSIMPAEWMPIRKRLEDCLAQGEGGLDGAIEAIKELAELNAEVIRISVDCYARLVARQ